MVILGDERPSVVRALQSAVEHVLYSRECLIGGEPSPIIELHLAAVERKLKAIISLVVKSATVVVLALAVVGCATKSQLQTCLDNSVPDTRNACFYKAEPEPPSVWDSIGRVLGDPNFWGGLAVEHQRRQPSDLEKRVRQLEHESWYRGIFP